MLVLDVFLATIVRNFAHRHIYVAVFPAVFYIFVTFEFAKTSSDKYTTDKYKCEIIELDVS